MEGVSGLLDNLGGRPAIQLESYRLAQATASNGVRLLDRRRVVSALALAPVRQNGSYILPCLGRTAVAVTYPRRRNRRNRRSRAEARRPRLAGVSDRRVRQRPDRCVAVTPAPAPGATTATNHPVVENYELRMRLARTKPNSPNNAMPAMRCSAVMSSTIWLGVMSCGIEPVSANVLNSRWSQTP